MEHSKTIKKYGIGIVFDTSEIGLEKRMLEEGSVSVSFGHVEYESGTYTLRIPDNTVQEKPIEIDLTQEKTNTDVTFDIYVGKNSRIVLVEKNAVREYADFKITVHVAENAHVEYIIFQDIHSLGYRMAKYQGKVERGASLTWFDLQVGGKIAASSIETTLIAEGAEGKIHGLFFGHDTQVFDIHHVIRHQAPNTTSYMETKGLLDGHAKTVYRGLIHISKGSKKCNGSEREDTLLLSKDAQIGSVPELEIGNNDVKCSHAVTTTQVDKNKLFYFESRGISKEVAIKQLADAHVTSIIEKINDQTVQTRIKEIMTAKLTV
ncbi:MAG TPA: SufD family Fe-S cluster assembly protein [Candidatus Kapabacteria bacterium]|nr:SufD family Fe-S cluster assembly protein [Candidatus Kapabacteria bacterium]